MASIFDQFKTFMTPERGDQMAAVGTALSQLDQGEAVDISSFLDQKKAREKSEALKAQLAEGGMMDKFTLEQQQMLATMGPEAAQEIIAKALFAKPEKRSTMMSPDGRLIDAQTGETIAGGFAKPVAAPAADPIKGIEFNGNLINPVTGDIIAEGSPEGDDLPSSVQEMQWRAQQMGLEPGSPEYQSFIANNGTAPSDNLPAKVQEFQFAAEQAGLVIGTPEYEAAAQQFLQDTVGGNRPPGVVVNTGDGSNLPPNVQSIDEKTGLMVVSDPNAPNGLRQVPIPGGAADVERVAQANAIGNESKKVLEQTSLMLADIDGLLADDSLGWAVGRSGPAMRALGPFAPGTADAVSKIEQIQGGTFMQAYQQLKGGGQITEVEGRKAEQAIARLNTNLSEEDFRTSLGELRDIIAGAQSRALGGASTDGISDSDLLGLYLGGS